VLVAFGVGDGTFHSDPSMIASLQLAGAPGDGQLKPLSQTVPELTFIQKVPLAIGDLTGDQRPDFVMSGGVFLSREGASCALISDYVCLGLSDNDWVQAAIGDFNDNGFADIVVLPSFATAFEFWNGFGELPGVVAGFNRTSVLGLGPLDNMTLGDFDGDFLADFAFREIRGSSEEPTSLSISWGEPYGPPQAPVSVARFPEIVAMGGGYLADFNASAVDHASDIGIIARSQPTEPDEPASFSAALFAGRGDRQLTSPYRLFNGVTTSIGLGAVAAQLDGDTHRDVFAVSGFPPQIAGLPGSDPMFWLMKSTGSAQIAPDQVRFKLVGDDRFQPCGVRIVPINLDSDPEEELAIFGFTKNSDARRGFVAIADSVAGNNGIEPVLTSLEEIEEWVFDGFTAIFACGLELGAGLSSSSAAEGPPDFFNYFGEALASDLNGDGQKEVVVLGYLPQQDKSIQVRLLVFQRAGNGGLDIEGRLALDLPFVEVPSQGMAPLATGLAALQADTDPGDEIVLVNPVGASLVDVDLDAGTLSDPVALIDERESLFNAFSAAAGDIDGDGVQDIAIGGANGVKVRFGVPVLR
jgi:hypothetical protein